MEKRIEQRACLKCCVANEITATESFKMLQKCFGEYTLSRSQVFAWHKAFSEGREVIENLPHACRPSTSVNDNNVDKVTETVLENRRVGIREIAEDLNISYGSAQQILINVLGMKRVNDTLVPKEMNLLQKRRRVEVAREMLDNVAEDHTFIKRIVTGDVAWVYEYDVEAVEQSTEKSTNNEPKPKKQRQSRSKIKGQTVNKEYYLAVLRRLHEAICRERPDLWAENSWILHHDNTPLHSNITVLDFLAKHETRVIAQPPYSPDLAPFDFFLFSKLKNMLRGTRHESIEAIQSHSLKALMAIPDKSYNKCMENWIKRWHACIGAKGEYFQGDNKDLY
ncbi:protein GVQW3 [Bactrocera oleae]|uniref:protein GVQW3 n=1 Tax=Bactrocera oleae TaxID=104688 RepID=UPI0006B6A0F5|nr:protein GVQW3 [Bactrocera oleae]